jgi:hypothetical protein
MSNNINYLDVRKIWNELESDNNPPKYLRNIHEISFSDFDLFFKSNSLNSLSSIIRNLYAGDIYLIRNSYTFEECMHIRKSCIKWASNEAESFQKTLDGCKNFYQRQTEGIAKSSLYSFLRIQTQYYLYRWNPDPYDLFKLADKTWTNYKILSGWTQDAFIRNIPSDSVVDRLHIHHYPIGIGKQELHSDPRLKQKFIQGCLLSKRGEDFTSGGIHYASQDKKLVDIDAMINQGDSYISYPTLMHSVELINQGKKPTWDLNVGRWFMGFYSMDSDHVSHRDRGWPAKM